MLKKILPFCVWKELKMSITKDPIFIEDDCFQKIFKQSANCSYDEMNKSPVPTDLLVVSSKTTSNLVGLIIRLPHSVADGTSMMIILDRILYFYDHPDEHVDICEVLPEPAENLLPEISEEQKNNFLERYHSEIINFNNVVPHHKYEERPVKFFKSESKPVEYEVTCGSGSATAPKKLLDFCREHGITIGTYLIASIAFINSKMTGDTSKDLKMDVDYNLRDRFPKKLGKTTVACYIGWPSLKPEAELQETLLETAKKASRNIKKQIDNHEHHMWRQIEDLWEEHEDEYQKVSDKNNGISKLTYRLTLSLYLASSINFSNVGRYPFGINYNVSTVKELYCTGDSWGAWFEYCILFQTTDRICITVSHLSTKEHNAAGWFRKNHR